MLIFKNFKVSNSHLFALNSLRRVINSEFPNGYWKTHVIAQVAKVYDLEEYRDLSEKVNTRVSSDNAVPVSEEDTSLAYGRVRVIFRSKINYRLASINSQFSYRYPNPCKIAKFYLYQIYSTFVLNVRTWLLLYGYIYKWLLI